MTTHALVTEVTKYDVDSPLEVVLEQWTTQQCALNALSVGLKSQLECCNNARDAINSALSAYLHKQRKPAVLRVFRAQWVNAEVRLEECSLKIDANTLDVYLDGRFMSCLQGFSDITKCLAEQQGLYFTKELALKALQKQYASVYLAIGAALESME